MSTGPGDLVVGRTHYPVIFAAGCRIGTGQTWNYNELQTQNYLFWVMVAGSPVAGLWSVEGSLIPEVCSRRNRNSGGQERGVSDFKPLSPENKP